jgi:hypothetical protein
MDPPLAAAILDYSILGSASNRLAFPNLTALSLYPCILAIYESNPTSDLARAYLSRYSRITCLQSLTHDLTDYL